jgi:hypothetical protein
MPQIDNVAVIVPAMAARTDLFGLGRLTKTEQADVAPDWEDNQFVWRNTRLKTIVQTIGKKGAS